MRAIAFYLPQFHPIPENDAWWGKGFTEWTNVVRARPLFRGHSQPHLPTELGFYDLRVPEVMAAQATLAREHGIAGFCIYHYWFNGRRVLERPVDDMLRTGAPDFPFLLCWANENWTRRWDGRDQEVLLEQAYSDEDDVAHIRSLLPAFADHRYLRVDGKPVFVVYRSARLPDSRRTTDRWREEAARAGIGELHLCRVESFTDERGDPGAAGFDAAIEFAPDWALLGSPVPTSRIRASAARLLGTTSRAVPRGLVVHEYDDVAALMQAKEAPPYLRYPCVTPRWDNTPRRKGTALVLRGSTPAAYGRWLRAAAARARAASTDSLLFINAWNEWGEGAHLEPDEEWGRAYLTATRDALA